MHLDRAFHSDSRVADAGRKSDGGGGALGVYPLVGAGIGEIWQAR